MISIDSSTSRQANISVLNLGPSDVAGETLTVSGIGAGLAVSVFVPAFRQCDGSYPGLSCSLPRIAAASGPGDKNCYAYAGHPANCAVAQISVDRNAQLLTINVSASFPDPNTSNNTITVTFPGSVNADTPPTTSTTKQQGGTPSLPVIGPTESATPSAQPSAVDSDSPGPAVGPVSARSPEQAAAVAPAPVGSHALAWIMAVAISLLLAAGTPVGLRFLARRRTRAAAPSSPPEALNETTPS